MVAFKTPIHKPPLFRYLTYIETQSLLLSLSLSTFSFLVLSSHLISSRRTNAQHVRVRTQSLWTRYVVVRAANAVSISPVSDLFRSAQAAHLGTGVHLLFPFMLISSHRWLPC